MSEKALKAVIAFLAGLILSAIGVGFWVGRNVPTADQVDQLIEHSAETNYLLRAHGITWEALQDAREADSDSADRVGPGDD